MLCIILFLFLFALQVNRGPVTSVDAMPPCARATDPAQLGAIGSDAPYTAVDRICSGFYFARADPSTIRLIARAIQKCGENPKLDDQVSRGTKNLQYNLTIETDTT